MNRPPSCGQHLKIGNALRSKFSLQNHFFARRVFGAHSFGECAGQRAQLRQHLELVEQPFGSLHIHQPVNALGDLIQPLHAQRQRHAPLAAKLVDEYRVARMALHILKQQRRAAGCVVRLCFACSVCLRFPPRRSSTRDR